MVQTPQKSLSLPNLDTTFTNIIEEDIWTKLESDFNASSRVTNFGNGGNLAVADHAAIDISRLTNKLGLCPGSGILASSLINDKGHDLWLEKWIEISARGLHQDSLNTSMSIGISSSGKSDNVVRALNYASSIGYASWLITASPVKTSLPTNFNVCTLKIDEYHTAEVLTLLLTYQLIHSAGFDCPSISAATSEAAPSFDFKN